MNRARSIVAYRVMVAVAALLAVGCRLLINWSTDPNFGLVDFWSFFTNQSNLLAAIVLLVAARRMATNTPSDRFNSVRGATVVSLSTAGAVYGLLLSGATGVLQAALPSIDTVLHRIVPVVIYADRLIDPPSRPIDLRRAAVWLFYPLAYVAYSLIRGPIVDWYPYSFLDPGASGGYGVVALYCIGITASLILFALGVVVLWRRGPQPDVAP